MSTLIQESTLAKTLAPEDIRVGDHVLVLRQTFELCSFYWSCDPSLLPPETPVRVELMPRHIRTPAKVKAVCLPLVLVRFKGGEHEQWDVRQMALGKVDEAYAKMVNRSLAVKNRKRRRRRSK